MMSYSIPNQIDILLIDKMSTDFNIEYLLKNAGYSVHLHTDGPLAIESFKDNLVGLILININSQEVNAFDLCRSLKSKEVTAHIPIFLLSNQYDVSNKIKGFQLGASDFISAPFSAEEILTKVSAMKKCGQLESDLKEIVFNYKTLLDSGQALIWTAGTDKKCNYFNKPWLEFTGRSLEQEIGDGWAEVVHPDDLARCVNTYTEAFDKRKKFSMEYRVRHCTGEYRWIQDDGSPRYNIKGEFIGYIGHCLDITERKQYEQSLKQQKNEFETIFNLVPAQIWYKDVNNRFLRVNKRVCSDTGYEKHELEGHDAAEVFPRFGKKYHRDDLNVTLSGKPSFGITEQIITKQGDIRWLHTDKIPVFDENENVKGIIAFVQDFTEQKKNKERWESLFHNSPNSIAVYQAVGAGNDFVFIDLNLKAQQTDKINSQDIIGKRVSELFPSAEGLGFLEIFKRVWLTGKTEFIPSSYYKDDRIEGWRENIIYRLNTGEIVAIYTDTSSKVKAERDLRQSEEKFSSIFEDHAAIQFLIEPDTGNITDVNQSAANYYGWSIDEMKKLNIMDINTLPSENLMFNLNQILLEKQNRFEVFHRQRSGSIRNVEVYCKKINVGEKVFLHSIVHDITDQIRAQNELQASNQLNRLLIQTIPFGIDIVDKAGNILFMSEGLQKQTRLSNINNKCWEVYRDNKTQCQNCPLIEGIKIGETNICENFGMMGEKIFQISHTGMLYNGKTALLEIFQDITDRKTSELELLKAKEKVEESDRLKTAFLRNISHEIRTPMNAIVGFSTLLNDPHLSFENRKNYTDTIINSSEKLLTIISDIINIATIEAEQVKIFEQKIDINSLIRFIYAKFIGEAQKNNLSFRFELGLPDNQAEIISDKLKMETILSNLVSNAIKFTKKGLIVFGYNVKENCLEFFVKDNGIGIPSGMGDVIFKRFRQIELKTTEQYGGTGLGLSISKAYVELLGGKIWFNSEFGIGSVFYFTIPLKNSIQNKLLLPLKKHKTIKTVLIAEDDDTNYLLLKEILSLKNLNIIRALNGSEAVELCKSNDQIDLVLMDIKMPVMDGLEATRKIKEFLPQIPVIAQSAFSFPDEKQKAFMAGCDAYLTKPVKFDELHQVITIIANEKSL